MTKKGGKILLSHTALNILDNCPRCFWLKINKGIRQPEGIVSRLASRFDVIIKAYFDKYRTNETLPPFLKGKVEGKLEEPFQEKYYYHHNDSYSYYGKLDECLVNEKNFYTPVDHKTSSSDPREKKTFLAYQNQLDAYHWLLEENGKTCSGSAHLIYYYPDTSENLHEGIPFIIHIETLKTDPKRAKMRFLKALEVIEGPLPKASSDCKFCEYRQMAKEFDQ